MRIERHRAVVGFVVAVGVVCGSQAMGQVLVNPANGNSYYETGYVSVFNGRAQAAAVGGYLVAINDAAEQTWLVNNFTSGISKYIGLSDEVTEGTFLWDSGEPFVYSNWAAGQPDNSGYGSAADYVVWSVNGNDWSDQSGIPNEHAIIETPESLGTGVTDVICTPVDSNVLIAWSNPVAFTSIEIARNAVVIATLPGSSTEYLDDTVSPGFHYYTVEGISGPTRSIPGTCQQYAANPDETLHLEDVQAATGDTVNENITLDNDVALSGWSFGVCHDGSQLQLLDVLPGPVTAAMNGGSGPGFYSVNQNPSGGDGFTVGLVVNLLGAETLPPGVGQEIHVASYEVLASAPALAEIDFCSTLADPPVAVVVVDVSGISSLPLTMNGSVTVSSIPNFERGDCNADGDVNLADVVHLGNQLFTSSNDFPCEEACETNGDGAVDIGDMVYLLNYLFVSGSPPGAPFPSCGPDPDPASSFGCDAPACP